MRNPPGPPKWWNLKRGEYDASAESNKQKWLYELWNYTRFGDGITLVSEYLAPGETDATSAFQAALDVGCGICIDGKFLISDTLVITKPVHLFGFGECSQIIVAATVDANTDIFEINPTLSEDKYQWSMRDFYIKAASGTPARHVFHIDITDVNKFIAKHNISNVRADEFGGDYLHLTNPVNTDGLFTSSYLDNFCTNGISLENSGDSLFFERNTITGSGIGFDIDQLGDASHIGLIANNITADGGGLSLKKGRNIDFHDNTVELTTTFTGDNNALISIGGDVGPPISNASGTKILYNNLNTQGNTTRCIYLGYATKTIIEGNTLFCDPATDIHIEITANAYNTVIGANNRYLTSVTGAETTPLITDNGFGTMGLLKDYTITLAGWALIDAANNYPATFIKNQNGLVTMFGALDGPAAGVGATFFTLPLGFRPSRIVKFWTHDTAGTPYVIDVLPAGSVQTPAGGPTSIYLDGMTWYSAPISV